MPENTGNDKYFQTRPNPAKNCKFSEINSLEAFFWIRYNLGPDSSVFINPVPSPSFPQENRPPTTPLSPTPNPSPGTPIGTRTPLRKLPPAKLPFSFCPMIPLYMGKMGSTCHFPRALPASIWDTALKS